MLRKIVIIILALTIRSTICAAVHAQITSYDNIQYEKDFDQSPFTKIGDSYYIIETTEKLNWFAAAHHCRKKGANLASIESICEMRALDEHLRAKYPDYHWFWLSGNDLSKENHFQWLSTGQSMEYTNWLAGEPNNIAYSEDCVHLRYDIASDRLKFNDFECTHKMNYVCEADNPKQVSITIW